MARIDWAVLCDLAFMDQQDRLCVIGVTRTFPVPALPIALHQVMLVAHLTDIQPVEEIGIVVSIVSPHGTSARPTTSEGIVIEMAAEYVLATLRDVPLAEEGMYRFEIALVGQQAASVGVSVLAASRSIAAQYH